MVNTSSRKRRRGTDTGSDAEPEKEYQVEAIIDKRVRGKKTEYMLKWKGYSHAENTWEDERRLNCPDLLKEFEEKAKSKGDQRQSPSKRESKVRKQVKTPSPRKSKASTADETDDEYRNEDGESMTTDTGTDSTKTDQDVGDGDRVVTRTSERKRAPKPADLSSSRRTSNRNIVKQTKSRIATMSKAESSNDEAESPAEEDDSSPRKKSAKRSSTSPKLTLTTNEASVITLDDDNNNNTIEFSDRTSSSKGSPVNARATSNLRSHLAPISNSSITFSTNENAQRRDKTPRQSETNDQDLSGLADETHLVDKIEAVRNDIEGLAFRIKFIDQNEPEWVASKIANRKYPQAVIAFWENHVEFT